MSAALLSSDDMWSFFIAPKLPTPLSYLPLIFRLLAILLAAPFAVAVALDMIAYAIARTLHISASSLRVPRSPPHVPSELRDEVEDEWSVTSPLASGLESRQLSPKKPAAPLPELSASAPAGGRLPRAAQLFTVGTAMLAVFLQWFSMTNNANALNALRNMYTPARVLAPTAPPTALVLTAHPDDEVMFFAPTILNLVSAGWDIHAVCVSDGNADGLGTVRNQELYASYARLGLASDNVTLIHNPDLQDGMSASWDPQLIATLIAPYIARYNVTHLITFDSTGVSGHPNHISLSKVHPYLASRPRLLELRSPSIAAKFTGPFYSLVLAGRDAVFRSSALASASAASASAPSATGGVLARTPVRKGEFALVSSPAQYVAALRAMLAHKSQLVWFRWLYVAFSHLMWVNQLIDTTAGSVPASVPVPA